MAAQSRIECSFLVPLSRDAELSDGAVHDTEAWNWLENELYERFEGLQTSPGIHAGVWKSPKTGERIADQSRKFVVAVAPDRVGELRILLAQACSVFCQQCIYLSVAGAVEFVESTHNGRST